MEFFNNIKKQYSAEGGYKEFLSIAFPLVVSTGIGAIQLFIDRIFLSMYSQISFAAATPAGISNWALECFFFGTLSYINVFVAQYYGKKELRTIGTAVWQSVYLSIFAALIILCVSFFSELFFMNIGHPEIIAREEVIFFRILCYGAFPNIVIATLSGFYSGRGKTRVVFLTSTFGVVLNIALDFCLIFGNFGFPQMGISGAAWATNIALTVVAIVYIILIISKKNNDIYNTRNMKIDFLFMKRLLCYGLPNGAEFFFDMMGFSIFMLIIGNLGSAELTASNIVATIGHIFIMPIVGFGTTISIMVGNYLGKNQLSFAQRSVKSSIHVVYTYIIIVVLILILFPNQLIYPFSGQAKIILVEQIKPMIVNLLMILAVYLVFDAGNIIFASAIKGAGDTMFVMKRLLIFSIFLVIIPTYLNIIIFKKSVYVAWCFLLFSVVALARSFYFRYRSNKWKKMRVIEMDISND
ncbi:MAG: MATE family efflux transporter [Endomicrobium sp.]|jgi:MATE family multidrug resistance protein|nr:MATE family efflux transporter [Endomicrobium sp.]